MKHNPPILSSRRNEVKERILKVLLHFTEIVSCPATSRYARCARYDKRWRLCKRERLYNMGKVIKEVVNNGNHDHQGRHVRIALCDWKILYIQLYECS